MISTPQSFLIDDCRHFDLQMGAQNLARQLPRCYSRFCGGQCDKHYVWLAFDLITVARETMGYRTKDAALTLMHHSKKLDNPHFYINGPDAPFGVAFSRVNGEMIIFQNEATARAFLGDVPDTDYDFLNLEDVRHLKYALMEQLD